MANPRNARRGRVKLARRKVETQRILAEEVDRYVQEAADQKNEGLKKIRQTGDSPPHGPGDLARNRP